MYFSIIIPTRNRPDLLRKCLESVMPGTQTFNPDLYEVIVSDDSKDTFSENMIKNDFPFVKWVKGPQKGPAANRNCGVAYAKGEWIVFTDDDCTADKKWLENYHFAIQKHENKYAFEGAIFPEGNTDTDLAECPVNLNGGNFWSANICIKKELFDSIGGFDENFKIAAQEDQDLFLQIKKRTEVPFIPEAIIVHPVRRSSLGKSLNKIISRSLNWSYYACKHKNVLGYKNNLGIIIEGYQSQLHSLLKAIKKGYLRQLIYSMGMLLLGVPVIIYDLLIGMKLRNRKFQWVSSITGNTQVINSVNRKLSGYYKQTEWRDTYQQMLNDKEPIPDKSDFSYLILDYILNRQPNKILDIGCGDGRIYRQLKQLGFSGKYSGIEVSDSLISRNKIRHPEATWEIAGAYSIPFKDEGFDLCFAFFVLEHLVYPEKALKEMLRVVKQHGDLVLVFPDFIASGRLSSQQLGFSPNDTSIQKLKKGKVADALVSIYDSRIRLPNALRKIHSKTGPFPINTNPVCFNHPQAMSPDFDAVYIASKKEIGVWAANNEYTASFPYGEEGELKEKAFMVINKSVK